ncbi:Signal transduction histidine kinase [Caballeronia glathei]|nr:Signal transduction histidine kinase [Caballeronia glathei]
MLMPSDPAVLKDRHSRRISRAVGRDARVVSVLAALIALAVFLIDSLTPLDIAIAVLYVVVVLLVSSTGNRPATIATAWGCVILTLFAFLMSHTEQYSGGAIARCVVSLLAIATTSVLSLRNQAATASLHEHIQERMQAEQALERSEAFLLDAQRLSRTASIATSLPEGTMWWSDEAYRIFEYPRDVEPSLEAVLARTHRDDLASVRGVREQALAGAPLIDLEHRLAMPDGRVKYVHFVTHLVRSQTGGTEYVGALMDITETKVAQEALARSTAELAHVTRITMLGELAASIAHEVTQPIAAIVTNGDASLRWLNRPSPDLMEVQQSITQMIRDAKRASDVIQQIRSMAKKRDPLPATLDLNEIVEQSIELVRRELDRHRVHVEIDFMTPSLAVCCDRVQLQQVLINLIMNGAQAMGDSGGPRRVRIATRRFDELHAQIVVQDSGTGISEENASRLFAAFFTTKAEGMGIGLSICRSIVEAHGGRIWAESPEEGGAMLLFTLPIAHPGVPGVL